MATSLEDIKEELRASKADQQMAPMNVGSDKDSMAAIQVRLSAIQKHLKGQSKGMELLAKKAMVGDPISILKHRRKRTWPVTGY